MSTIRSFGVGVVSLVIILMVVVGGYNLLALNLGTVSGDYFLGAAAVLVLLGGAWLSMQDLGYIGKPFMLGATIVLIAITLRHRNPGVADLISQTQKEADRTAQTLAVNLSSARVIPCDRTTTRIRFFEQSTGKPLIWLSENEDGTLTCYDRPGFHPQTRKVFVAVDEALAQRVLTQEPQIAQQKIAVAPTPPVLSVQPHETLPDLSEGPISK